MKFASVYEHLPLPLCFIFMFFYFLYQCFVHAMKLSEFVCSE